MQEFKTQALNLVDLLEGSSSFPLASRVRKLLEALPEPQLADLMASILKASFDEKFEILTADSVEERFRKTLPLIKRQIEILEHKGAGEAGNSAHGNKKRRKMRTFSMFGGGGSGHDAGEDDDLDEIEAKLK